MICFPNAKINLGLNIVSKRPDGYHNLETVFYPIDLKDALEITPCSMDQPYRFHQLGIPISGDPDKNLVIKAYNLFAELINIPPIEIRLLKTIPFGAGLGGGSSDAAFMLSLLNKTFSSDFSIDELAAMATKIGADCPFFLYNKPAFATGIGDELEIIELDLDSYYFVLVKPDFSVPTKDAYSMITPSKPDISLKEIVKRPISEWKTLMKNDFEIPVFKKYPEIQKIKQQLYDYGALYTSMSGSGSSVYAFFKDPVKVSFPNNYFVWTNMEL
ncbi:MAG: 4-(cytidine 5'-diphospho)-2-C-methyl-D-erythritol kinase [Dysgonamonadaceae bacterium]|nr:4-(cytidine 5'-diphospho)-2-C-methyl-D-erythritol kinase [Dysgonamonadaceae bacterium]MEA5081654.1 4-(cytidine 5'-diphospho)-2-C-methyl-D-erythritol kinase [Dysgonamonadaceae bacterium]